MTHNALDAPSPGANEVLSHYRVLDKLGEGGMGVLYRARDTRLERTVAVKLLRPDVVGEEGHRWRFVQEARAASALNHPNIVTIYEIDRQPGPAGADFIVMEYIDGQPLSKVIAGRRLDVLEALGYALPVASALAAAHAAGITHRDVKPANVMVTASGQVKILDFGLAKLQPPLATADAATGTVTTGPRTTEGMILGTPAYMSPEQAQGRPVDARSDVFSLGAMLYEMLSGRRPFLGDNQIALLTAILRDEPPALGSLRADVPRDLERLVHRCLEKDREKRPVAQAVADELGAIQRRLTNPQAGLAAAMRRKAVAVPLALVLVAAAAAAAIAWGRVARERWARHTAMPEIARLAVDHEGAVKAFRLAEEIKPIVGDDPRFQELLRQIALPMTLETDPPGAAASYKGYLTPEAPWQPFGRTPLREVAVPFTHLRWRFEKDGYAPAEVAFFALKPPHVTLVALGAAPPGMVRVAAGSPAVFGVKPAKTEPFWLDRYEVTNAEYKKFVDGGGYRRPELWKHAFVLAGRTLAPEEALARFVDSTGRPGPATWELGTFPEGKGDLPVGGVSWYEAAAFAEFSGKALPTVHHWFRAAGHDIFSEILRFSNFGGEGPQPGGRNQGMGPFGTFDMAGNVREWCWNEVGGRRYVLGGAWTDATYMFTGTEALPPFDRQPMNGIRLARYDAPPSEDTTGRVEFEFRDYTKERPVGDAVFAVYRSLYDYDRSDLAPKLESVDDTSEHWRREKITIAAAYGGERFAVYLFLPKNAKPPYQVVQYFPPGSVYRLPSSERIRSREFGFLVRSGRAVVFPVYKGTYERRRPPGAFGPSVMRDLDVQAVKDARRALDYVDTRPDLDKTRIGYYGLSTGASMGVLIAAVEPRVRVVALTGGGLPQYTPLPETDGLHFAPRITAPTLMSNGRYDFVNPVEYSQLPLFRLLGTPPADKRHFLFEGGHVPPSQQELIRETLAWLDRYLGPVSPAGS